MGHAGRMKHIWCASCGRRNEEVQTALSPHDGDAIVAVVGATLPPPPAPYDAALEPDALECFVSVSKRQARLWLHHSWAAAMRAAQRNLPLINPPSQRSLIQARTRGKRK